jgi:phosphoglycolate phosphatase
MWPRAVIFDLDGTLIDTLPDIAAALNSVIQGRGLDPFPRPDVRTMIGKGPRNLLERALTARGQAVTEADIDAGVEGFVSAYNSAPEAYGRVFDGVETVLQNLKSSGVRLAVCTNKQKSSALHSLEGFGLIDWFEVVTGAGDTGYRKPDPRHLQATLHDLGLDADDVIMVGDSDNDIGAARGAGVKSILVSFGYHHQPLDHIDADVIIDAFDEMPAAIEALHP